MTGPGDVGVGLFTLTFDSSPIKGEGILLVGLACFTLTFDSSPIKGEGILSVVSSCFTLAFDSSPIKRPLQNPTSFPCRRESIGKSNLED